MMAHLVNNTNADRDQIVDFLQICEQDSGGDSLSLHGEMRGFKSAENKLDAT